MYIKITSKRQVTFPKRVLESLGVGPGDQIGLEETENGFLLRPRRLDPSGLAPLRHLVRPGQEPFDIHKFRETPYDPSLRD